MTRPKARCNGCGLTPDQLPEYSPESTGAGVSAEIYVWEEEGTLNPLNGHFLCTQCYIAAGMPTNPDGSEYRWVAP